MHPNFYAKKKIFRKYVHVWRRGCNMWAIEQRHIHTVSSSTSPSPFSVREFSIFFLSLLFSRYAFTDEVYLYIYVCAMPSSANLHYFYMNCYRRHIILYLVIPLRILRMYTDVDCIFANNIPTNQMPTAFLVFVYTKKIPFRLRFPSSCCNTRHNT